MNAQTLALALRLKAAFLANATCNCGAIATVSSPEYEKNMVPTHEVWCKSNETHR